MSNKRQEAVESAQIKNKKDYRDSCTKGGVSRCPLELSNNDEGILLENQGADAPKSLNKADFPKVGGEISQKQNRHIKGHKDYRGGGVMDSTADAQKVLDSYNSGQTQIIGKTKQGFPIIQFKGVQGTHISGDYVQKTTIFIVKGTKKPSIVPTNPNFGQ